MLDLDPEYLHIIIQITSGLLLKLVKNQFLLYEVDCFFLSKFSQCWVGSVLVDIIIIFVGRMFIGLFKGYSTNYNQPSGPCGFVVQNLVQMNSSRKCCQTLFFGWKTLENSLLWTKVAPVELSLNNCSSGSII